MFSWANVNLCGRPAQLGSYQINDGANLFTQNVRRPVDEAYVWLRDDRIRTRLYGAVFITGWLSVVAVGMGSMAVYSTDAGSKGATPSGWPQSSALKPHHNLPTLVMIAHPRCAIMTSVGILWCGFKALLCGHPDGVAPLRTGVGGIDSHRPHSNRHHGKPACDENGAIQASSNSVITEPHISLIDEDGGGFEGKTFAPSLSGLGTDGNR